MLTVFIDGACEPVNPKGTASYGLVVYRGKARLFTKSAIVGSGEGMSNNVAEYSGLIAFWEWLDEQPSVAEEIVIKSDSQLLIKQMRGEWQVRGSLYVPYHLKAMGYLATNLAIHKDKIRFQWIPREENWEADRLSKDALSAHGIKVTER